MLRRIANALSQRDSAQPVPPRADTYPEVALFHWSPPGGERNFGDHLSKIIAARVAAEHGLTFDDEVSAPARMLAIGSILHFARDGDVVWGSGWNGKIAFDRLHAANLDIRAVRGPKTAAFLKERGFDVPAVFGDPGLLTRRYFGDRFPLRPSREFIVIPNLNDLATTGSLPNVCSPLQGWNRVVDAITQARRVVTSSLHGLVIAEAFGVPVRLIRFSGAEDSFKFDDYAMGTGRDPLGVSDTLDHALSAEPYAPIAFDEEALVQAFPTDLWR
jgi:pyruvyltransferase